MLYTVHYTQGRNWAHMRESRPGPYLAYQIHFRGGGGPANNRCVKLSLLT